ncbi:MAG: permease prefix domain 1-containing protein [Mobilitalea sp.]
MEQQHGPSKNLNLFLEDVVEQIQYIPAREEVKAELTAHIEDRKEEYREQGMEELTAYNKAIEDMGDAIEIGIRMNEVRKLQSNKPALLLIMSLFALGVMGNIRLIITTNSGDWFRHLFYFLFGFMVFGVIYYFGYQKLVGNSRKITAILLGVWGLYLLLSILNRFINSYYLFRLTGLSFIFGMELLCIPVIIAIIYLNRSKKQVPFLISTISTASIIVITTMLIRDYTLIANLILLVSITFTLLFMIMKGMLVGKTRNLIFGWVISAGIVVTTFIAAFNVNNGRWNYILEQGFYPEKVIQDTWDDSYNSILIKKLLGQAEVVGTIELSQDELMGYYTGTWYFDDIDEFDYKYKMQFVEPEEIRLENILPQHYQNNYRIAYWILKYGWLPAAILIGIIVAAYGMLIRMVGLIKNKMGKALAFSSVTALILQTVLYFLGNFGYQFGWFCNLPLISEGLCSITTNMILVGLACSAYRYDKVIKEVGGKKIAKNLVI